MNKLDDQILAAIRKDAEETIADYRDDLSFFGLIGESFKGKMRWIVIIAFALILISIGFAIYTGIEFLHASTVVSKLNWMAGVLLSVIILAILRLWYFMELNRVALHRDIKRVELQLALVAKKLDELNNSV